MPNHFLFNDARAPRAARRAPIAAVSAGTGQGAAPHKRTVNDDAVILIVDDEPAIIEIVQLYLEDAGYSRFVTTTDPTQVMRLVEESSPDALLLDVIMPGRSGLEVLAEIRAAERPSPVPVLVLTSATDAGTKQQALELGASDFLAKPVDPSELVLRLRNVLAAKAYQDRLAYIDEATDLPNRRHFVEQLKREVTRTQHSGRFCALLHIGLDRFQKVTAAVGYNETAALLRAVAKRINLEFRSSDGLGKDSTARREGAVARIASDEFILLLADLDNVAAVPHIAERVLGTLDEPVACGSHELRIGASVGVAFCPLDGVDADALMTNAGQAMHYAREQGGGTIQFYSDDIQSWSLERMQIEADLGFALSSNALSLHYQPKVDLRSGRIYGVEALMRWSHPERGPVSPAVFIPVAEETGLIKSMGAWALRTSCEQAMAWSRAGLPPLSVAVNVSARQLDGHELRATVEQALVESGLPASRLTLEITEGMIMSDPEHAVKVLKALKALGVRLSVDDFGTGYSSLAYLKRLPLDELKIDQSFIKDIPNDKDDMAIVSAVIVLARSLGLHLVAEGVEIEAQRRYLAARDCDACQGYLFARPMPGDAIEALLRDQDGMARSMRTDAA